MSSYNWRDELECRPFYKKKFALLPITTKNGEKIWLKYYFKKFNLYHHRNNTLHCHTDFVESISEEEMVVRKLSEKS